MTQPDPKQREESAREQEPPERIDPLTGTVPLVQWRQLGGGGLILAGALQCVGAIVAAFPGVLGPSAWFFPLAYLFLAIAATFVAFGSTGSNGAVGTSVVGKLAMVVFGVGWLVVFLAGAFGQGSAVTVYVALALVTVGGLVAGFVILLRGLAGGVAGYAFIVMVVLAALYLAETAVSLLAIDWWLGLVFGVLVIATGVSYVLVRPRRVLGGAASGKP